VVKSTSRPLYPREWPGTHLIGGWVGRRLCVDGCGKSRTSTKIRSPDCPARNESLYRLSYPSPHCISSGDSFRFLSGTKCVHKCNWVKSVDDTNKMSYLLATV
jgi:hypothetical protein